MLRKWLAEILIGALIISLPVSVGISIHRIQGRLVRLELLSKRVTELERNMSALRHLVDTSLRIDRACQTLYHLAQAEADPSDITVHIPLGVLAESLTIIHPGYEHECYLSPRFTRLVRTPTGNYLLITTKDRGKYYVSAWPLRGGF